VGVSDAMYYNWRKLILIVFYGSFGIIHFFRL